MDHMADIVADTRRYRDEALAGLAKLLAGGPVAPGMSREQAIATLKNSIEIFDETLRHYGWRDDA